MNGTYSSTIRSHPVPTTTLSNGIVVPLIGLGCASGVKKQHVVTALRTGYRYLDTAQAYQWGYNEADVAEAIEESTHDDDAVVTRQEIFVVTKIHPENLGYASTVRAVQSSLALKGFQGYLDAVLIHKPRCWEGACGNRRPEGTWQDSWKALEEFYAQGKVRAIGICDVNDQHLLEELLAQNIQPHIIQNWFDPFHQDANMRTQIQQHGILYQGYSSLGTQWKHFKGLAENPVLNSPKLKELTQKHQAPGPAAVALQWATRRGISVLPASTSPQRQAQNLFATFDFTLSEMDLQEIDAMDGTAPNLNNNNNKQPNPNEISVTFSNPSDTITIRALWINPDTQDEVPLGDIEPENDLTLNSYHGHAFIFRRTNEADDSDVILRHELSRQAGTKQSIVVVAPIMEEEL